MTERHPGRITPQPNLDAPTEELKIVGSPIVEAANKEVYSVELRLSRELTAGEQDAYFGWRTPPQTPAGFVYFDSDNKVMTVVNTTIELVAQHRDALRDLVSRLAAEGEEYRRQALDAQQQMREQAEADAAELARRQKIADEITFDE